MSTQFHTTVTVPTPEGDQVELELTARVQDAEPDVGIMGAYVEEWWISAINHDGSPTPEQVEEAGKWLAEEYGDDTAVAEWMTEQLD